MTNGIIPRFLRFQFGSHFWDAVYYMRQIYRPRIKKTTRIHVEIPKRGICILNSVP